MNALKRKGLVFGAQKTLLDTMPKIRNLAMHANGDKITPPDVSSVIGFVEQLSFVKLRLWLARAPDHQRYNHRHSL